MQLFMHKPTTTWSKEERRGGKGRQEKGRSRRGGMREEGKKENSSKSPPGLTGIM